MSSKQSFWPDFTCHQYGISVAGGADVPSDEDRGDTIVFAVYLVVVPDTKSKGL